jgi:hypothetical protein
MIDGYGLYELINDGQEHTAKVAGVTYRFAFRGQRYGSNNWLEVTGPNGTVKKWGWGWNSEVCWKCLDDLANGWEGPHRHKYRPYTGEQYGYE